MGTVFFAYSVRYYTATLLTLLSSMLLSNGNGYTNGNGHPRGLMRFLRRHGNGHANGNGNGNGHFELGYEPFVSIHIATYNEKRVVNRLLEGCAALEYGSYEVVVVDDSTDESATVLGSWRRRPRFKIVHRERRDGFKGGALQVALEHMDPRTEFVIVWDADVVPFPDSIQTFLPHFFNSDGKDAQPRADVAAVQSYQWHVLNKSESWLTEAVRAEYAGSYMVERPFQESDRLVEDGRGDHLHAPRRAASPAGLGTEPDRGLGAVPAPLRPGLQSRLHALRGVTRRVRGHLRAPCPPAHALGGGSQLQRTPLVCRHHAVAAHHPDGEDRVPLLLELLPPGCAVRRRQHCVAGRRGLASHAFAGVDRAARLVALPDEPARASVDEHGGPDARGCARKGFCRRPRGAGHLIPAGSVPGVRRHQGLLGARRRSVVSHAENRPDHRPDQAFAAAGLASPLAFRQPRAAPPRHDREQRVEAGFGTSQGAVGVDCGDRDGRGRLRHGDCSAARPGRRILPRLAILAARSVGPPDLLQPDQQHS